MILQLVSNPHRFNVWGLSGHTSSAGLIHTHPLSPAPADISSEPQQYFKHEIKSSSIPQAPAQKTCKFISCTFVALLNITMTTADSDNGQLLYHRFF